MSYSSLDANMRIWLWNKYQITVNRYKIWYSRLSPASASALNCIAVQINRCLLHLHNLNAWWIANWKSMIYALSIIETIFFVSHEPERLPSKKVTRDYYWCELHLELEHRFNAIGTFYSFYSRVQFPIWRCFCHTYRCYPPYTMMHKHTFFN